MLYRHHPYPYPSPMPPLYILPRGHGLFQITDQPDVINQAIRLRPIEGTIPSSERSTKPNVRLDKSVFEEGGGENAPSSDCNPETCRELDLDDPNDILWFLQKIHKDVKDASLEKLRELDEDFADVITGMKVIDYDPLIMQIDPDQMIHPWSEETWIWFVGYHDNQRVSSLIKGYMLVLISLKRDGKPLPKPHPDAYYGLGRLSHDVSEKSSPPNKSGSEDIDGFFWNFTDFQTDFFELNNGALYVYGMGILLLISLFIWFMSRKRNTVTSNKNGADM